MLIIFQDEPFSHEVSHLLCSLPLSVGGGPYSITAVPTYVCPSIPSVHAKNVFRSIFFEKVSVLDSYFRHRYIKCRSSSIKGKIHQFLWELWPFFNFIIFSVCTKNVFCLISSEKISVQDSYFIHRCIIITYIQGSH